MTPLVSTGGEALFSAGYLQENSCPRDSLAEKDLHSPPDCKDNLHAISVSSYFLGDSQRIALQLLSASAEVLRFPIVALSDHNTMKTKHIAH